MHAVALFSPGFLTRKKPNEMVVLIDNYDSFVHNLARYLRRLGQETEVIRNDAVAPAEIIGQSPTAIVLSPGPCTPDEAGCSLDLVRLAAGRIPLLGVCLGHQTVAAALGGEVIRADEPMHGRTSLIQHSACGLFAGLPIPLTVGRYHSLIVRESTLPRELEVTARTDDGVIMAIAHRRWPVYGVQFHPESVLTEGGYPLLANFLRLAGARATTEVPNLESERPVVVTPPPLPARPVTF
jgi:anthranilate synthase/aminodeoxychorismate synthase-like glutamine amidotransferase